MNKQDILNAFRKEFEVRNYEADAHAWDIHVNDRPEEIEQWLLNTLTEFEREKEKEIEREYKAREWEAKGRLNELETQITMMDKIQNMQELETHIIWMKSGRRFYLSNFSKLSQPELEKEKHT